MDAREKRRQKLEQNPKHVRFEELDLVLRDYGFRSHSPSGGGSHRFYIRGMHLLGVPRRRPHLKEYVVRRALAILRQIDAEEANTDED